MFNFASIFGILQSLGSALQIIFSIVSSLTGFFGGVFGPFLP